MKLEVKLFAAAKQAAGSDAVRVDLAGGSTVADLRIELASQVPALAEMIDQVRFSVNHDYARDDTPLVPDCEVACIPPVSGG